MENDLLPVDVGPELQDMLDRFPLPEGVPDADMNQAEIAAALEVTVNTLGKWCDDPSFPVAQRGGMGKPYVLRLSHCWAWRQANIDREEQRRQKNREVLEKLQASFLGFEVDDPQASLSPEQRKKLAEADFAWSRAQQLRRQLVPMTELQEMLDSVFAIIRNSVECLPDRLERELSLKPEEVALVQRFASDLLGSMVAEIEASQLDGQSIEDVEPQDRLLI